MFKKLDHVTYVAQDGEGPTIRGIVRRAHRDGSCTVEARFVLDETGADRPGFLGYKYRISNDALSHLSR